MINIFHIDCGILPKQPAALLYSNVYSLYRRVIFEHIVTHSSFIPRQAVIVRTCTSHNCQVMVW